MLCYASLLYFTALQSFDVRRSTVANFLPFHDYTLLRCSSLQIRYADATIPSAAATTAAATTAAATTAATATATAAATASLGCTFAKQICGQDIIPNALIENVDASVPALGLLSTSP